MFSRVRRVTGLSRKYFWRSRKFFIVQNVNAVHFYKMKLGELFFKAFVKPRKPPKTAFFEQKMNFSEKSFGRIKNPRPETQSKLGSKNTFSLLFWALEPYLRKSPKCAVSLQKEYQVSVARHASIQISSHLDTWIPKKQFWRLFRRASFQINTFKLKLQGRLHKNVL